MRPGRVSRLVGNYGSEPSRDHVINDDLDELANHVDLLERARADDVNDVHHVNDDKALDADAHGPAAGAE